MFGLKKYTQDFTFTSRSDIQTTSEILQFIEEKTAELGTSRKESIHISMMCEESLVKLLEYVDFSGSSPIKAVVSVRKFMGDVNFTLRIPGQSFDFLKSLQSNLLPDSEELTSDTADAINNILLQTFEDRIKYTHRNGYNFIRIAAIKSPYASLIRTLEAIVLAVIIGLLMKNYASGELCTAFSKNILSPIRSILMNALKICAVPLVFFSLVTSITRFGNLDDMRRLGLRCLSCFFSAQVLSAVIAVTVFFVMRPLFSSSAGIISGLIPSAGGTEHSIFAELLSKLVPASVLHPFIDSDMLQLLVLGILFGIAVKAADAKTMRKLIEESNAVFTKLLVMILKLVPLLVFCSMADMVLSSGFSIISKLTGIAVIAVISYLAMFGLYCIAVAFMGGISVSRLISGAAPAMLTAASVLSSGAVIPSNMKACEKVGVPHEVYSISAPMASIFNENGDCIVKITTALFLALMCGIEVSVSSIVSLIIYSVIVIMSASGFTAFLVIPAYLGVPMAAIELAIGNTQLLDIGSVALDAFGTVASSVLIAGKKNILPAKN